MTDKAPSGLANLARRLSGRRLLARLAILFEGLWPALWPPLGQEMDQDCFPCTQAGIAVQAIAWCTNKPTSADVVGGR